MHPRFQSICILDAILIPGSSMFSLPSFYLFFISGHLRHETPKNPCSIIPWGLKHGFPS